MYQVLLVDDDPLMISGLKHLIDWGKNGCIVGETASNGIEALEKLERLRPDIVVCDIFIPGLTGVELLKQANMQFPDTVFVMLTNHEEFSFVREALHCRAVKYLVKSNLDGETLEEALTQAILERENRKKLHRIAEADEFLLAERRQAHIRSALERFLRDRNPLPPEDAALLEEEGMLSLFAFAFIPLNFAVIPGYSEIPDDERRTIFSWEMEIAERLGSAFFRHSLLLPFSLSDEESSLLLFAWKLSEREWESGSALFKDRLIKMSIQITRLGVDVQASRLYAKKSIQNNLIQSFLTESPAIALSHMMHEYYADRTVIHSDAVGKARQYILDNVEKQIMVQDVANHACISAGYLSTLFKKEYHQNLVDFINQTKVNRACELLRERKYRISEISFMLGFDNAFYFTKVFHRRTGMTPSEYQAVITPPPPHKLLIGYRYVFGFAAGWGNTQRQKSYNFVKKA